jgi:hypothetical protein
MAEFYPELNEELKRFIEAQRIFFVASAPPDGGRVNISPKGYKTFSVIDSKTVAYIDYPGSGNETARHIAQGGMVTVMFCSFDAKPMVLRLYCRGEVLPLDEAERRGLLARMKLEVPSYARQVILLHIQEVMTSCGYGVPYYKYLGERETLREWCKRKQAEGKLEEYMGRKR